MTAQAIDVNGLTKSFSGKTVVNGVDVQVQRGSIFGFLGPNGSGKTTTIRLIRGLLRADAGRGTCLDFDVLRESQQIKARVDHLTQNYSLYADPSGRENLTFMARLQRVRRVRALAEHALEESAQPPGPGGGITPAITGNASACRWCSDI